MPTNLIRWVTRLLLAGFLLLLLTTLVMQRRRIMELTSEVATLRAKIAVPETASPVAVGATNAPARSN